MRRGIIFLVVWFVLAVVLGFVFVPAIPPGGVDWPYYIFVASIPIGAMFYARFAGRAVAVICYGVLAGVLFALPIFDDQRAVMAGAMTPESVALKVGLFALAMLLVCSGAFVFGRRLFRRDERHAV